MPAKPALSQRPTTHRRLKDEIDGGLSGLAGVRSRPFPRNPFLQIATCAAFRAARRPSQRGAPGLSIARGAVRGRDPMRCSRIMHPRLVQTVLPVKTCPRMGLSLTYVAKRGEEPGGSDRGGVMVRAVKRPDRYKGLPAIFQRWTVGANHGKTGGALSTVSSVPWEQAEGNGSGRNTSSSFRDGAISAAHLALSREHCGVEA